MENVGYYSIWLRLLDLVWAGLERSVCGGGAVEQERGHTEEGKGGTTTEGWEDLMRGCLLGMLALDLCVMFNIENFADCHNVAMIALW